jgi:putative ABC transport system permease protein
MLDGLFARLRSLRRGLRHRDGLDAEMDEEFRQHIALRTADLIHSGLPADEAERQARVEFGHAMTHREDARASRGLRWLDAVGFSWIDVRLGLRMLRKYPGLSLISIIGMTVAIAIGAGAFAFIESVMDPRLPLPEGDRIVSIQNNTRMRGSPDRQTLYDFVEWRRQLTSVRDVSAFMSERRNLILPGRAVALVGIAQMTASGFRVARIAPLLGRPLLDADEQPGATPVVVIGYDEWQERFDGDSGVVGRTVRLGTMVHTVVGVMPPGFRFPLSDEYWVPLVLDPTQYERGGGPAIFVFGRLADGVTLTQAQTELSTIGHRLEAAYPEKHRDVVPEVLPYVWPFIGIDSPGWAWLMHAAELALALLLVVIAVNVAILVYARTAARAGEIAVRTALGASRRRIVTQLFAESLVSSGTAAVIGLTLAAIALREVMAYQRISAAPRELPFWMHFGISPGVVVYTAGLAILAAIIVGVLPALKATGRRVQSGLQQLSSHGSGMRLGRTWTVLIVAQVAVAVAALPFAVYVSGVSLQRATLKPVYPAGQLLRTWLSMEREEAPPAADGETYQRTMSARFHGNVAELVRRLETEPAVARVSVSSAFPDGGSDERIEVEGLAGDTVQGAALHWARRIDVDTAFLPALDVPLLAGRRFGPDDARPNANAVIVDRVFAERMLPGESALGRRIRGVRRTTDYTCSWQPDGTRVCSPAPGETRLEIGPWLDIVGVTPAFALQDDFDLLEARMYRPLNLAEASGVTLALSVRVRNGPAVAFSPRLTSIATSVDPALQLHDLKTYSAALRESQQALLALALVIVAVTASVLLLSAGGIYAMMSFTVVRRRREIGIRLALGANPRRLLRDVFARASAQLLAGTVVGLLLAAAIIGPMDPQILVLLPVVAAIMVVVGLLAALGPARRGLAVQPTETLREE